MLMDPVEPAGPRHRERLEIVHQAGDHLRVLVEEMLDLTRIEAGGLAVAVRDLELCELLEGVLGICEPDAKEHDVQLHKGRDWPVAVHLQSDPGRLRQVALNLVSNAIKYNRPGGWVRVDIERDPHFVHFVVRDGGMGMSDAQLAQLFQPFNRLGREAGTVPGTGLGLSLVRQIVGLLGGEIAVQSRPNEGTTVRVTLPAAASAIRPPAPAPESVLRGDVRDTDRDVQGVVLYIEDNPVNAVLVEQMLARWPRVQVVVATDGASGLDLARDLHPDLVLLDMQLPDMTGLEVIQRLRAQAGLADTTVVALSASALPEEVAAARDAGVADYWTKPIACGALLAGVRKFLA